MPRYRLRLRRPRFRGVRTPVLLPGQSARRLALLGLGAAVLVAPLWLLTTQTIEGQRVADLILYGRVLADPAAREIAVEALATVSIAAAGITALGLATLGLVRGGFGLAIASLVLIGGANVTTVLLEELLLRPNLLGSAAYATGNSFPSGHIALVASLGFAAILVVPRRLRTPVAILASALVAVVGLSTITAGWHRLADVVGAVLISLAWASIVAAILVVAQGWMPRRTWGTGLGGPATTLTGLAGVVVIVVGVTALLVTALDPAPLTQAIAVGTSEPRTFTAALITALGSALVACAGYVWAMRGVALESRAVAPGPNL